MSDVDDHTMNACLARVIGKVTKERTTESGDNKFLVYYGDEGVDIYDPLHDANQMEEVEAWVRENGYEFSVTWSKRDGHYTVEMYLNPNPSGDPSALYRHVMDIDKKRAFALAVQAMEEGKA